MLDVSWLCLHQNLRCQDQLFDLSIFVIPWFSRLAWRAFSIIILAKKMLVLNHEKFSDNWSVSKNGLDFLHWLKISRFKYIFCGRREIFRVVVCSLWTTTTLNKENTLEMSIRWNVHNSKYKINLTKKSKISTRSKATHAFFWYLCLRVGSKSATEPSRDSRLWR